jgi:predicted MFS family arabinose efflux permease
LPTSLHHTRAITLLSAAAFAGAASTRVCDPMLPELARVFAASPAEAAHAVSGFAVAYGLLQLVFGPLGDRIGKYRLIALTTLVCTLGSLGAALATSLNWLVAARVLSGATAAGIIPLSMAWIGDTVAYEERQATLARFLGGQILGVIGGQFIGGFFVDTLGWRWAFVFLGLVYLAVGALVLAESGRNPVTRHHAATGTAHAGIVRQGLSVLAVPWARVILTTVFLEGMVLFGALAFVPYHLHERFGLTLLRAGACMGLFGVGGLSYIVFAKGFVRRLGEVGLAAAGGLAITAAYALMAAAPSWAWTLPAIYLVGLGFYMLHNTLQTNATQMAPAVRGTAVSLFACALFLGQSAGVVLAAMLLAERGTVVLFVAAALAIPAIGGGFARRLQLRRRGLAHRPG